MHNLLTIYKIENDEMSSIMNIQTIYYKMQSLCPFFNQGGEIQW